MFSSQVSRTKSNSRHFGLNRKGIYSRLRTSSNDDDDDDDDDDDIVKNVIYVDIKTKKN